MKHVLKKISAIAMAFTLLGTGTAISAKDSKNNELVATAANGNSEHFFKTWRWYEIHGDYVYCYDCLYCTSCDYQTQPRLVTVQHK